jgi:hypothetical protein
MSVCQQHRLQRLTPQSIIFGHLIILMPSMRSVLNNGAGLQRQTAFVYGSGEHQKS